MRDAVTEATLRVREGACDQQVPSLSQQAVPTHDDSPDFKRRSGRYASKKCSRRAAAGQEREVDGLIAALLGISAATPDRVIMGAIVLMIVMAILATHL